MDKKSVFGLLGSAFITSKAWGLASRSGSIKDKVILVTGGSKGLGLVLAKHLISEGARIAICARDKEELLKAQSFLEKEGAKVFISPCDVGKKEEVEDLIKKVIAHFGHLDIVINNAGIIVVGAMNSFGHEEYKEAMDVMYWGIVNTTLAAVPHMK